MTSTVLTFQRFDQTHVAKSPIKVNLMLVKIVIVLKLLLYVYKSKMNIIKDDHNGVQPPIHNESNSIDWRFDSMCRDLD